MDDQKSGLNTRPRSSADEQTAATKIIDLDDDCLEKIFRHLDFSSLFNVAVSNEWLRPAARSVYGRRFATIKVVFEPCSNSNGDPSIHHRISTPGKFHDVRTCLQFLRCFGPSITNLEIGSYLLGCKGAVYLQRYINEYCAESLVSVRYLWTPIFSKKNFQKPFTNVQSVKISGVDLGNELQFFAEWFPNLRRLEVSKVVGHRFVATHFPHLEHLRIGIGKRDATKDGSPKKMVANLLRLNPQLQSLNINLELQQMITLTSLLKMAIDNFSISTLVISIEGHVRIAYAAELIKFATARPALTTIELPNIRFSVDDVIAIICQLNALKTFCFLLKAHAEFNDLKRQLSNGWKAKHFGWKAKHSDWYPYPMIKLTRD